MTFVVVSCTKCGAPRVADPRSATAQCPQCHQRIDLGAATVHVTTSSLDEARDALGQLNAARMGGTFTRTAPAREPPRDAIDHAITGARDARGEATRVQLAAHGLTAHLGAFSEDEWVEALRRLDLPRARAVEHLDKLVEQAVVAETRPGTYRHVG